MKHRPAKATKTCSTVRGKKYVRHVVTWYDEDGKRQRKSFSDAKSATREAKRINDDQAKKEQAHEIIKNKIGEDANKLDAAKLRDAADALAVLRGYASLTTAAEYFMRFAKPDAGEAAIQDVAAKFLANREAGGLRSATINSYADKIKRFTKDIGAKTPIHHVTLERFETWLDGMTSNQGSRKSYLRHLGAFFQYAVDRGFMVENPSRKLKAKMDAKPVTYLTAAESEKLLSAAREHDPALVPYIALGLFAGLRPSEIHGERTGHGPLDWRNIHLADSEPYIDIKPTQDKNREGRHVDVSANLMKWLSPYRQKAGAIVYTRSRFENVVEKSGVDYGKDILRHSFGTWHWAMHRHEGETAIQLGDTIKTVKKHYVNQRVKKSDAAKYWRIEPKTESNVIEMQAAG